MLIEDVQTEWQTQETLECGSDSTTGPLSIRLLLFNGALHEVFGGDAV